MNSTLELYIASREKRERREQETNVKKRAALRMVDGGASCAEAAREFNIRADTVRKWKAERT